MSALRGSCLRLVLWSNPDSLLENSAPLTTASLLYQPSAPSYWIIPIHVSVLPREKGEICISTTHCPLTSASFSAFIYS